MKVGTKSILFGVHCWFIHPWFVATAWTKLYGFPWDFRLWVCFFVHDLGYWGKPNMDGPEGETHVELGANIVHWLFDHPKWIHAPELDVFTVNDFGRRVCIETTVLNTCWKDFCLYHSRFYAKRDGQPFSRLCVADKLAVALEPWWLYLPRVIMTGEIHEYMELSKTRTEAGEPAVGKYAHMDVYVLSRRQWFERVCEYLRAWSEEHKSMKEDTWSPK